MAFQKKETKSPIKQQKEQLRSLLLESFLEPKYRIKEQISTPDIEVFSEACSDRLSAKLCFDKSGRLTKLAYSGEGCVLFLGTFEVLINLVIDKDREIFSEVIDEFNLLLEQGKTKTSLLGILVVLAQTDSITTRQNCLRLSLSAISKIFNFQSKAVL